MKKEKLRAMWANLTTKIELVLDEEGYNMAEGKVRSMPPKGYIYVDEVNGYCLLSQAEYENLITQEMDE